MTAGGLGPSNGGRPQNRWNARQPRAYWSAAGAGRPTNTSGAAYRASSSRRSSWMPMLPDDDLLADAVVEPQVGVGHRPVPEDAADLHVRVVGVERRDERLV